MDTQTTIWVDANGHTRATIVRSTGGSATIQADLVAKSYADIQQSWHGTPTINTPSTSTGIYQTVLDYAVLTFTTAGGNLVYLTLPAPLSSIFLADQETVDSTQIATLITACVGTLTDQAGTAVSAYVSGIRRRSTREYQ